MEWVLGLAGYAALTVFAGPLLLSRGRWRLRYPRLCLLLWHILLASGLLATAIAIAIAVGLGMQAHRAMDPARGWLGPTTDIFAAWIALAAAGVLLSVVSARVGAMVVAERQAKDALASLVEGTAYRQELVRGLRVTYISSEVPIAYSWSGRRHGVVVSSRVDAELLPAELRAVVEHERAHLSGRHHLALRLAALNCACLPQLLGPRELRRATALLIELIADDHAVRHCGSADTISALAKLGSVQGDEGMLLRARRLQELALAH